MKVSEINMQGYNTDRNDMNVAQLRELAAELDIAGRSKMRRAELLNAIAFAEQDAPAPTSDIHNHDAAVARMRANREAEEEERAAARRARNRTNYAPATESDAQADDAEQPDRVSYYSETVPCFERTTVDGIGYGCVKLGEHVEHNTALGAAWWVATEADEQADTEAGELLEAVLGERADSPVTVTVDRYTEGRASVKMQGHAFGDMTREAYRIGRKWELIDQEHGIVFFTIRAGSLQKAVKAWAKKLNTHAERIDVARSF